MKKETVKSAVTLVDKMALHKISVITSKPNKSGAMIIYLDGKKISYVNARNLYSNYCVNPELYGRVYVWAVACDEEKTIELIKAAIAKIENVEDDGSNDDSDEDCLATLDTAIEEIEDTEDELADEYIVVDEFKFAEELLKIATAKSNANENGEKYVADVKYFYKKVMELAQKAGYKFVARVGYFEGGNVKSTYKYCKTMKAAVEYIRQNFKGYDWHIDYLDYNREYFWKEQTIASGNSELDTVEMHNLIRLDDPCQSMFLICGYLIPDYKKVKEFLATTNLEELATRAKAVYDSTRYAIFEERVWLLKCSIEKADIDDINYYGEQVIEYAEKRIPNAEKESLAKNAVEEDAEFVAGCEYKNQGTLGGVFHVTKRTKCYVEGYLVIGSDVIKQKHRIGHTRKGEMTKNVADWMDDYKEKLWVSAVDKINTSARKAS